jgi:hypothetical protein
LRAREAGVVADKHLSEFATLRAIKADYVPCGDVELTNGRVTSILGGRVTPDESMFLAECQRRMKTNVVTATSGPGLFDPAHRNESGGLIGRTE